MASPSGGQPDCRLSFQEAMELRDLPVSEEASRSGVVGRFMSLRPAWLLGTDIEGIADLCGEGKPLWGTPLASFGGHVYAQSGVVAARVVDAEEKAEGVADGERRRGIHSIHGFFTSFVLSDRPIFYEVSPISNTQFSFRTYLVTARQPEDSSSAPPQRGWDWRGGDATYRFPVEDSTRQEWSDLKPVCFSATVSFKLPEPHSSGLEEQETPAQVRFAEVLARRRPQDWLPAPRLDVQGIIEAMRKRGDQDWASQIGSFPVLDMKKVDMTAWNTGKPLFEQRQLILYRILKPLRGRDAINDNAHVLVHAYGADRNGLLMACNALGSHYLIRMVTSMAYSFAIHTNVEDLVMRHESQTEGGESEWWVQEVLFTRVANARVMMESKIWNPRGLHVATVYQDGLLRMQLGLDEEGPTPKL